MCNDDETRVHDLIDRPRAPAHTAATMLALMRGLGHAQPGDLPERMIAGDPDTFFGHFLDIWPAEPAAIDGDVRGAYLSAARRPGAIHAVCQDYRASAFVDADHDAEDRAASRRLAQPVLAMWQDPGDIPLPFDPAGVWSSWAPDLRTPVLDCGHFLPEERPEEVIEAIGVLLCQRGRTTAP